MTKFAMGQNKSGALAEQLCDLLKRPADACQAGKYQVGGHTRGFGSIGDAKAIRVCARQRQAQFCWLGMLAQRVCAGGKIAGLATVWR